MKKATPWQRWMKIGGCLLAAAVAALIFVRCGSAPESLDARPQPDAPPAPVTEPSEVFQTTGGGAAASSNYHAQVSIGAPQPMGATASANYELQLGPSAR
ncbi:hypothetical protein [Haliangium sp.]|uniref:hypothetical protein n=1 Tax=Haliangium sp. TaxID=2663208 RepID=UPI003D09FFC6